MRYVIWVQTMKTHRYLFYYTTIHKWLYCIFPTSTCFQQLLSPLGEFTHIIPVHCGYSWNDSVQIPASNAINNVYTSIRNHDLAMPIRFSIRTVMRPAPETSDIGLQHSAWLYFLISGIMFVRRCRQRSIYHFGFHKSIFSPYPISVLPAASVLNSRLSFGGRPGFPVFSGGSRDAACSQPPFSLFYHEKVAMNKCFVYFLFFKHTPEVMDISTYT